MSTNAKKTASDLIQVMSEQIKLLKTFVEYEESLRTCITASDWEGLGKAIKNCQPVIDSIEELESKRTECVLDLAEAVDAMDSGSFYHIIVKLDTQDRDTLSALYRELKLAVLRIQGITWSIDAHVRTVTVAMRNILADMYPHKRGTMYGAKGETLTDSDPLVVNKSL